MTEHAGKVIDTFIFTSVLKCSHLQGTISHFHCTSSSCVNDILTSLNSIMYNNYKLVGRIVVQWMWRKKHQLLCWSSTASIGCSSPAAWLVLCAWHHQEENERHDVHPLQKTRRNGCHCDKIGFLDNKFNWDHREQQSQIGHIPD